MTRAITRLSRLVLAATAGLGFLFLSDDVSLKQGVSFSSHAEARIGRPLTPMSYAGVARRTTRRAVYRGAAVGVAAGAAVGAAAYYRPGCVQAVDAYGRIYWRCP
jgi:hypothetical protein